MTCMPTSYTRYFAFLLPLLLTACGGGGSDAPPPTPPVDSTPPTVSAVTVPAGSSVNRIVSLSATASDAGGISEVRFLVDGAQVGSDTTAPYTFDWDTSTVADGQYYRASTSLRQGLAMLGRNGEPTSKMARGLGLTNEWHARQVARLSRFIRENGDAAFGRLLRGYQYILLGRNDAAREDLIAAIELDPRDTLAASLLQQTTAGTPGTLPWEQLPTPTAEPSVDGD